MLDAATGVATAAVSAGRTIFESNVPAGGRVFSHWSQYCLLTGAVLAAISGVAFAILTMYPVVIINGVLVLICLVGVYYLKQFVPIREMEEDIATVNRKARQLLVANRDLATENQRLQGLEQNLRQDQSVAEAHRRQIEEQAKQRIAELERTAQALQVSVDRSAAEGKERAANEKALADQAANATSVAKASLATFAQLTQSLTRNAEGSKELADGSAQLTVLLTSLSTNSADYAKQISQLSAAIDLLTKQFAKSMEVNASINQRLTVLQKENAALQETAKQFKDGAGNIKNATEAARQVTASMDRQIASREAQVHADKDLSKRVDDLLNIRV